MQSEIPDKLYFKIGEVSKLAGVEPHVLRYWETEFKTIKPKRATSNQRMYRRDDIELILTIKTLLHEKGYTISGARHYLSSPKIIEQKNTTIPTDHSKISSWLGAIKKELIQVQSILQNKNEINDTK